MRISRRGRRLARTGSIRVRVRCRADEPETCVGVLRLSTWRRFKTSTGLRRIRLGGAKFRMSPGTTKRVRVRITRRGRRLVRRKGRVRVLANARARDATGNLGTKKVRFLLRAPTS
jgi:hypothetical protein